MLLLLASLPSLAQAQLKVFACEPEWASLSYAIAGEHAEIFSATHALQDPHHIEARPALIAQLRRADLLVCSGAELEVGWLPLLLRSANNAKVMPGTAGYFEAAMQVDRLDIPAQLDRSLGDIHAQGNPHVQLDPLRMLQIAAQLTQRLTQMDAAHANDYQQNLQKLQTQMQQLLSELEPQLAHLKNKPVVIHHDSWKYLADWLQLKIVGNIEPKPGIPPSPTDLQNLLQQLHNQPVSLIIRSSYQSDKPTLWLSTHLKVPAIGLPATVSNGQSLPAYYRHLVNELARVIP
jgi:zinc/manganese transport system substrate-binding protein